MTEAFRGIFPALQATFFEDGALDTDSMARQVEHNIACGTHGLVFPVLGGELKHMSVPERKVMAETVVETAAGRVPTVVGVTAPCAPIAADLASHAASAGAQAIISLPPYPNSGGKEDLLAYYNAIADASGLPVFIQHTGGALTPAMIVELLEQNPMIQYVKEETPPSGHSISAILADVDPKDCQGVFGGAHGQWMVTEMRRGATGFVPAAMCTDLYVAVWDAYQTKGEEAAWEAFECLRPMLRLLGLVGLRLCKDILVRRGVITSNHMRVPGAGSMDEHDERDLDLAWEKMAPHFTV